MVLVWSTGVLFRKIKQPPVLGELLAGIIFGPSLLGYISLDPTLSTLSELGMSHSQLYSRKHQGQRGKFFRSLKTNNRTKHLYPRGHNRMKASLRISCYL
ncbi:cation:proton antiporter [Nitrospirota bacterium]